MKKVEVPADPMPQGWKIAKGERIVALYHHHLAVMSFDADRQSPGFFLQGQAGHFVPHRVFQTFLAECQRMKEKGDE